MTVEFTWYIEDYIVLARLTGDVTVADLETGNHTILNCMAATTAPCIHTIYDLRKITRVSFSTRRILDTLPFLRAPEMGAFVVFGTPDHLNGVVNLMGNVITRLTRTPFYNVPSFQDALSVIHRIDPETGALMESKAVNGAD